MTVDRHERLPVERRGGWWRLADGAGRIWLRPWYRLEPIRRPE